MKKKPASRPDKDPPKDPPEKRGPGKTDEVRPPQDLPQYADRPLPEFGAPEEPGRLPGGQPGGPRYGDTEPGDPRRPGPKTGRTGLPRNTPDEGPAPAESDAATGPA